MILESAAKSKDDISNKVSKEIVAIVSKIDFVKEASRFVEEHKFRVSAEIEVIRRDPSGANESAVEVKIQNVKPSRR